MAKPGLDGHSNGAEQIAVAARDAGFEVVYQGIRLSPAEIAAAARDEDVDVVGISILSGSHLELVPEVVERLRAAGVDVPVVVGGIIPPEDAGILIGEGVARVYTPKDYELEQMMDDLLELAEKHRASVGLTDRGRPGGRGRVGGCGGRDAAGACGGCGLGCGCGCGGIRLPSSLPDRPPPTGRLPPATFPWWPLVAT